MSEARGPGPEPEPPVAAPDGVDDADAGPAEGPDVAPSRAARVKAFAARHEGEAWAVLLGGAVLVLVLGLVLAPDLFWDRFLWRDIWGPTLADARHVGALCWNGGVEDAAVRFEGGRAQYHCPGGGTLATSGYTLVSEITYGLTLAALLYGIYRHLLRRYEVDTGGAFLVALLPLIMLGPMARVMEDAAVFHRADGEPGLFAPVFISPWIYFQIAFYALAFLGVGILLDRRGASDRARRAVVGGLLALMTAAYAAVTLLFPQEFAAVAPWWAFAAAAAAAFGVHVALEGRTERRLHATVFVLGLPLLAPSAWLLVQWVVGPQWAPHPRGLQVAAGLLMLAFAFGATYLVWWLLRLAGAARPALLGFTLPVNVALLFGHMLDGWATWIALKDPFHLGLAQYVEKHPVSDLLLQAFRGTPLEGTVLDGILFPVAKLAMVLLVVHLVDKEFGTGRAGGGEAERTLGGLVKLAVFVVGFAPGLRNLLLVVMGF